MKIRVMVVEDEPPIQRSICKKIETVNGNFQVVAAVNNGKEALRYLEKNPVDVLFVDMNLPVMNGQELLKCVAKQGINVIPVVLSGYTDFSYVKGAFISNAMDYLLKPLKDSELRLLLERIEEKFSKQQFEEKAQKLEEALEGPKPPEEQEKKAKTGQEYCMLLLTLGNSFGASGESDLNYGGMFGRMSLKTEMAHVIPGKSFWVVDGKNVNEKLIFIRKENEPDVNRFRQVFRKPDYAPLNLTAVYYCEAVDISEIFSVYRMLQKYTDQHRIFLKDALFVYRSGSLQTEVPDPRKELDRLLLQCGNVGPEQLFEVFSRLLKSLTEHPVTHREAVRHIKYFISKLCSKHPGHREYFELEDEIQFILDHYYTEEEIRKEFQFLFRDAFGSASGDFKDKSLLADKMKIYLDENFRTNITNQLLAERFGFVGSYLSSIFKSFYGFTPIDYVMQKRIGEGKRLLKTGDMKIKEVAGQLGYDDSLYFSKVFKKVTGMSPKEYVQQETEKRR